DFNVLENATIGTEIGRLDTTEQNGYYITSEDSNPFMQYFDRGVVENQGIIKTIKKLDHETFSSFDIAVYDSVLNRYFEVRIDVTDINDHAPEFRVSQLNLTISEASQIGAKYNLGTAVDPDSDPFNVQGYTIISGNEDKAFRLNNRHINGQIYVDLIVNQTLNRELVSNYSFTVEAFDGDVPPKTGQLDVYIDISDVNDNPPVFDFSRYTVRLSENEPVGRDVITLNATDQDIGQNAMLTYRIDRSQSDPGFIFEIESNSGRIYLNKKLDFEQVVQHKLVVEARDEGSEPQVGSTVVIVEVTDVNDNEPQINVIFLDAGEAKVSEGAEPGDYIARVSVSDQDLGELSQVNVSLEGGNGRFGLQTENNIIYLVCVKLKLDRETESLYHITLNAVDFGSPPQSATTSFTITVEDINDNPPRFPSDLIEIELSQSAFPGTFVTQLQSTDADIGRNAEVTYRLDGSPQSLWLNINPHSGLITTARSLDSLTSPELQVTVWATDGGTPALASNATLVIRLSDAVNSPPRFQSSSYAVSVPEDAAVGHCFLKVHATDPDSSVISYSFVIGSLQDPPTNFQVNSSSGDVCVTSSLNRETTASYDLQIQATDQGGQWDRAPLVITIEDVNDNKPVFSPVSYVINVDRNADVGTPITKLTATDADDVTGSGYGRVTFVMTSGNDEALFALDTETGRISVAKPLTTNGVGSMYEIDVAAVDGGGLSSDVDASVVISIVDGSSTGGPVFTQARYFFQASEADPKETLLGTISATANDGRAVTYFIRHDPPHSTWFSVRPTGDVIVRSPMDREIFPSITFQVIASSGSPPIFGFAMVTVTISDVNDNPPHFISSSAGRLEPIIIPFSSLVGATLHSVVAIDNDEGRNGQVKYRLQSDFFSIDSNTGVILLTSALPHQATNYSVTIEAYDQGQSPHVTSVELIIRTIQPDPNCPVFPEDFRFSVAEDTALSKRYFSSIHASTTNSTAKIAYYLQSSSSAFIFSIFSNGSLYLIRGLDYETQDTYSFEVEKRESFDISRIISAQINLRDVNDHTPRFNSGSMIFGVEENTRIGEEVYRFRAVDPDSGLSGRLTYSLVSQTPASVFRINSDTGALFVDSGIDREAVDQYILVVTDRSPTSPRFSTASARVIVRDVNDNSPRFVGHHMTYVAEDEPIGYPAMRLAAEDADAGVNGRVMYAIESVTSDLGNSAEEMSYFHIDSNTGVITVAKQLDFERSKTHSINVSASDLATNQRTTHQMITIHLMDVNDVTPHFERTTYQAEVMEGQIAGTIVTKVTALDEDSGENGLLTYQLQASSESAAFVIDPNNEVISLAMELDRENKSSYRLTVFAQDSAFPSLYDWCFVLVTVVDVNDNAPQFSPLDGSIVPPLLSRLEIPEHIEGPQVVHTIAARDADIGENGQITYAISGEHNDISDFSINPSTGELSITRRLDRELTGLYQLQVTASDNIHTTSGQIEVTVLDWNDNDPQFVAASYNGQVAEGLSRGQYVLTVRATDADIGLNGEISYFLSNTTGLDGKFTVDTMTGVVTTTAPLDREEKGSYNFLVEAVDAAPYGPRSSTVPVSITGRIRGTYFLPNYNPVLRYTHVITRPAPALMTTMISYLFFIFAIFTVFGNESMNQTVFEIDRIHGNIRTREAIPSNFPNRSSLIILASDGGNPPMRASAVIEINLDGDNMVYQLNSGNENEAFAMSSEGVITVDKPSLLDYETEPNIRLIVSASVVGDGPYTAIHGYATVYIQLQDENDNSPRFTQDIYSISVWEEQQPGIFVMPVQATDADSENNGWVWYFISSGNLDESFELEPLTGFLKTKLKLDREVHEKYTLIVNAVDQSEIRRTGTSTVSVLVVDTNDHSPTLNVPAAPLLVSEGTAVGSLITTVTANDQDASPVITFSFPQEGNPGEHFSIDRNEGKIFLNKPLDFERSQNFTLTIQASDIGSDVTHNVTQNIHVVVTDVNDNPPVFLQQSYHTTFPELALPNTHVITVQAKDLDSHENGRVSYRLDNVLPNKPIFQINHDTGEITVNKSEPLNPQSSVFNLEVEAYDHGSPRRVQSASVRVQITDINNNPPMFNQQGYEASVIESASRDFSIINITATDADYSRDNNVIVYRILSGNTDKVFKIRTIDGPGTQVFGEICVAGELDRESVDRYSLTVAAIDQGTPSLSSNTTVLINVLDVNDNRPTFNQTSYHGRAEIPENAKANTTLLRLVADDNDGGAFGHVTYSLSRARSRSTDLTCTNDRDIMRVNSATGEVYATQDLDFEQCDRYFFYVVATDAGGSSDIIPVSIDVLPVDEFAPMF
uniref:Cadherin domain-containing protein n=1 Tax=Ciona savignyi TaxID=51511 RepID=H2ZF79_CIOSA